MTMPTCTVLASGVFSLFSGLAFASRDHIVRRVIFFDFGCKFGSRTNLLVTIAPILDVFAIPALAVTYVTHEDQAAQNIVDWCSVRDTRVVFAESLQSKRIQDLLRMLGPEQIHFYAEGAMSFGPIRNGLPADLARELHSVHYVAYSGLKPLALKQFPARDAGMSRGDFKALFLKLFDILDAHYQDLTEIDHFISACPSGGVLLLHQNLSSIAGFDTESEREIFTGIQKQIMQLAAPVIFIHPKSARNVPDIFDIDLRAKDGNSCTFVAPPFPMAEYYVYKLTPKLCLGIFSSALLNLKVLNIPIVTLNTYEVGHEIESAFDSNIYALHFTQLSLGSTEHIGCIYPSVDFDRLIERLEDNDFSRCHDKSTRLWELPYYLGDQKLLAANLAQVQADWSSLNYFRNMPAFRRLSPSRKEMLMNATLTPAQIRKRKQGRLSKNAYSAVKKVVIGLMLKGRKA